MARSALGRGGAVRGDLSLLLVPLLRLSWGLPMLTTPGVWGVTLAALYGALFFGPGWDSTWSAWSR